ncbi:LLM class F420-dependent oxidoreductase [Mycolicibacterium grossiae]|uniref:LLM class F420-dependent oxidoreductase n=1 Tax=Mycolicibacterium grossiae TaxID=1552759 RepID=A0A1E8PX08_9MYCO|nr:LLM class F420-dependent oxidoreductase [Mycolicibacterium grossiae]OFJ50882.1 LLM class F420-dependent oxidoreductase [Mycolicibacterium grossiae]QEM46922.1 LLM class F420-dependent oxidoreductase [Mycolicibacterium grossiae]
MTRPVRVAVQIQPGGTPDYATWRDAVVAADDLGVDVIFGYDHFHFPAMEGIVDGKPILTEDQPDVPNFEGWTALASWGEITSHAEIGLLVTGVGYRNPDLLADMARTVDHISGGRLILGLGAGWYEKDYTTYGYEFGTFASRFDLFDESLIRIENRLAALNPPPVRKLPILIGGTGPKRSLPAIARHADIWHAFQGLDAFRTSSERVDELAASFGRNGADIERSTLWENGESADAFREAGVTLFQTELTAKNGYDLGSLKEVLAWRDNG